MAKKRGLIPPSNGSIVKFDGTSVDGRSSGSFPVEVLDGNYVTEGYDNRGLHVIPQAWVKNVRTGKEFAAYLHTLKGEVKNPGIVKNKWIKVKAIKFLGGGKIQVKV